MGCLLLAFLPPTPVPRPKGISLTNLLVQRRHPVTKQVNAPVFQFSSPGDLSTPLHSRRHGSRLRVGLIVADQGPRGALHGWTGQLVGEGIGQMLERGPAWDRLGKAGDRREEGR